MGAVLALHSSSAVLGVGVQWLDADGEAAQASQVRAFPLGRDLSNQLLPCIEQVLPAGPGGFTGTRLTVVLARTLAQQLQLPLDGVGSFGLAALRLGIQEPTWLVQELPRRGVVAGLYAPDPAGPGESQAAAPLSIVELEAPRLFAPGVPLPPGPQRPAAAQLPDDVAHLLAWSVAAQARGLAAPWQPVLPHYPTSPVAGL